MTYQWKCSSLHLSQYDQPITVMSYLTVQPKGMTAIRDDITFKFACPLTSAHCGTTNDFNTTFIHFSLFSTALWDFANSRPVRPLVLSSHLLLCLPCLLPPFTVPCKMVLARPDERETWPYHCSLRLFTIVRRSSLWSSCLLHLGMDFLVGNMVFVRDA